MFVFEKFILVGFMLDFGANRKTISAAPFILKWSEIGGERGGQEQKAPEKKIAVLEGPIPLAADQI